MSQACVNLCVLQDKLLDSVVRSLETRFQCLESSQVLKTASKLVDPREWQQDASLLIPESGNRMPQNLPSTAELNVLLPHFGEILTSQGCDLATTRRVEWPKLKVAVKRLPTGMQSPSLWEQFATDQDDRRNLAIFCSCLILHLYSHSPLPVLREASPPRNGSRETGGANSALSLCLS